MFYGDRMTKILITGTTGKVGRRIIEQLAGHPGLRALAHSDRSAATLTTQGVDVARGSLDDPAALDAALADIDALFLLTPYTPDQGATELRVLHAARAAGVTRVVKLSSVLQGRPIRVMRGHAEVSAALPSLGFAHVSILQPDNFMDNELASVDTLHQGLLFANAGEARLSFVDARDIAAVAVAELTSDTPAGGDLVITGPDALTFSEYAGRLGAALDRPVQHISPPDADFTQALLDAGLPDFYAHDLTEMFASIRDSGLTHAPTDTVQRLTGHAPRTVEDFARDVLAPALTLTGASS